MDQNAGSFMSPTGQQGAGSALLRLMRLRAMNASPGALNANTQNPNAVMPSAPPTSPAIPPMGQAAPQATPTPQAVPQPQPAIVQPQATPDTNLATAMQALGNYIKAHGEAHMAQHGVPLQKAQAAAIAQQGQQGGQ